MFLHRHTSKTGAISSYCVTTREYGVGKGVLSYGSKERSGYKYKS